MSEPTFVELARAQLSDADVTVQTRGTLQNQILWLQRPLEHLHARQHSAHMCSLLRRQNDRRQSKRRSGERGTGGRSGIGYGTGYRIEQRTHVPKENLTLLEQSFGQILINRPQRTESERQGNVPPLMSRTSYQLFLQRILTLGGILYVVTTT